MLSDTYPQIEERVGTALAHGDLRQRALHEGSGDIDAIGALGLVGITETMADAVFRLKYSLDAKTYPEALGAVYQLALSIDRRDRSREKWRWPRWRLWLMAHRVLDYWLVDVCPACTGRRYITTPGSPHLSDQACSFCHATGKREMPWVRKLPKPPEGRRATKARMEKYRRVCRRLTERMDRHRHLLVELEKLERVIGGKVIARLAREVREL